MKQLFFLLLSSCALFAQNFKDELLKAVPGDFLVTKLEETTTLLLIKDVNAKKVVIEEIATSYPLHLKRGETWQDWLNQGAPGSTSWIGYEIDLKKERLIECFSYSQGKWLSPKEEYFFLKLLTLPLHHLDSRERKKVGPAPNHLKKDLRQNWSPTFHLDGKKFRKAPTEALAGQWPKDGSKLSDAELTLYFSQEHPLPVWIELVGRGYVAKIHSLENGHALHSPNDCTIPYRIPRLLAQPKWEHHVLKLQLEVPRYLSKFHILSPSGESHLPFHCKSKGSEKVTIEIDEKDLLALIKQNPHPTLRLIPDKKPSLWTEIEL